MAWWFSCCWQIKFATCLIGTECFVTFIVNSEFRVFSWSFYLVFGESLGCLWNNMMAGESHLPPWPSIEILLLLSAELHSFQVVQLCSLRLIVNMLSNPRKAAKRRKFSKFPPKSNWQL